MAKLTTLPHELVDEVLKNVQGSKGATQSLSAVSQVCKPLRHHAESFLYQKIKWVSNGEHAPPVHLLVRTVLERGELAKYIEHIHLRGWHRTRTPPALFKGDYAMLHDALNSLSWWNKGPWYQGLEFGKTDMFLAVLVSKCSNLKRLSLDFHYGANDSLVHQVLLSKTHRRYHTPERPRNFEQFSKLKEIEFVSQDLQGVAVERYREATINIEHLWSAFVIPTVQHIVVENLAHHSLKWPLQPSLNASSLISLTIEGARCDERNLERLLSSCKVLRELTWERMCDCSYDDSCQPNCDVLYEALLHVKNSIESLTISIEFYTTTAIDFGNPGPWTLEGRSGSLKDFSKLERMDVPFAVLLGWKFAEAPNLGDILPSNLRVLELNDDTYTMIENGLYVRRPLNRLIDYVKSKAHYETGLDAKSADSEIHPSGLQRLSLRLCWQEWIDVAEYLDLQGHCYNSGLSYQLNCMRPEGVRSSDHWYHCCHAKDWKDMLEEVPRDVY